MLGNVTATLAIHAVGTILGGGIFAVTSNVFGVSQPKAAAAYGIGYGLTSGVASQCFEAMREAADLPPAFLLPSFVASVVIGHHGGKALAQAACKVDITAIEAFKLQLGGVAVAIPTGMALGLALSAAMVSMRA